MPVIPDYKIEEVRQATDIVDLVSGYVTLKQKGRNLFGLCPFHAEKTPSFSVNPDKEIFHCFGCGAGGNAFTFLMRYEGVSFPEAVKALAQRAGITLEFEEGQEEDRKENETLYAVNEFAARFYQERLLGDDGKNALAYLKSRGFKPEDIEKFGIGYAPAGWRELLNAAKKQAVSTEALVKAGLVLEKEGSEPYDRFRDRVMFTIWNLSGRVVAFGGRILADQPNTPKYINSPETAVYEKGRLLYGLYQNRDEIRHRDRAIFVEGYTDLMSLVSVGVRNVVATLGTALTADQSKLIRRYTRNVVMMYDSDSAGTIATLRGGDVLLENGLNAFIIRLPQGYDPDSFAREQGREALGRHIEAATPLFDFKLDRALAESTEKRSGAIRTILESLSRHTDAIQRSMLLKKVAERLNVDEHMLWDELEGLLRTKNRTQYRKRSEIAEKLEQLGRVGRADKAALAADDLVRILIHDWSMADMLFEHLSVDEIGEVRARPVLDYLFNIYRSGGRPLEAELMRRFNDVQLSAFLVGIFSTEYAEDEIMFEPWAVDCIATIKIANIDAELQRIQEDIRQLKPEGETLREQLLICKALEDDKRRWQRKRSNLRNR